MNYFLYGSEQYLLKQRLNRLILDVVNEIDAMNTIYYDGTQSNFNLLMILDDANTLPFLVEKKTIVIMNPPFLASSQVLSEIEYTALSTYLAHDNPFTTLFFYLEEDKFDSRKKGIKLLQKMCKVITVNPLDSREFQMTVKEDIRKQNLNITSEALEELFRRLPNSMQTWKNELEKLLLLNRKIEKEDVVKLVVKPLEEDVFQLVNYVIDKKLSLAMQSWKDLSVSNKDPIYLIVLIGNQLRLMFQCGVLQKMGKSEREITEYMGIHPFRVKKAIEASRLKNIDVILRILSSLAKLDQDIKVGKVDKILGFELFLIEATR